MEISTAARNAACDAVVDRLDGGTGNGYIEIRSGASPGIGAAASGTLLATLTCSDPAFGNAGASSPGEAIAAAITGDTSADATGTAGYFRAFDGDGTAHWDGDCGTSGADLNLNTTSITAGDPVEVTSWTVTMPAS